MLDNTQQQVGVPVTEHERIKKLVKQREDEAKAIKVELADRKEFWRTKEHRVTVLEREYNEAKEALERKQVELEDKEEQVVVLRAKIKEL